LQNQQKLFRWLTVLFFNGQLSFLRKQESIFFDNSGFRIKCGMTGNRKREKKNGGNIMELIKTTLLNKKASGGSLFAVGERDGMDQAKNPPNGKL
jgi:hypothetical protein